MALRSGTGNGDVRAGSVSEPLERPKTPGGERSESEDERVAGDRLYWLVVYGGGGKLPLSYRILRGTGEQRVTADDVNLFQRTVLIKIHIKANLSAHPHLSGQRWVFGAGSRLHKLFRLGVRQPHFLGEGRAAYEARTEDNYQSTHHGEQFSSIVCIAKAGVF